MWQAALLDSAVGRGKAPPHGSYRLNFPTSQNRSHIMAKVMPFHSAQLGSRNVHHDNDRCTEGNNIERHNRRHGTGGRPRCDHCNRLG
jgi:hypothetical protein